MPATMSDALLDVNVLIAAIFADHPAHAMALQFVQQLDRFYTTPTTQGGFLRFATRAWKDTGQRQFPPRLNMAAGLATLQKLTTLQSHTFLPDDLAYTDLSATKLRGHRQWTDAYLLHLARRHGLRFATFDTAIASLDQPSSPAVHIVR
jgi:uncharacterized protein